MKKLEPKYNDLLVSIRDFPEVIAKWFPRLKAAFEGENMERCRGRQRASSDFTSSCLSASFLAVRQIALEGEINREQQMAIKIPAISMGVFKEMSPCRWLKTVQPFERN
jgi:hypothetical protein